MNIIEAGLTSKVSISGSLKISNNPLVSIIIPVYNNARTLKRCVESIVNQTYDNWEIIIVDSYSHDDTRKIALEYQRRLGSNRCSYHNTKKIYQSQKFNYGFQVSKGDRIYLQGSDQYLTPTVLEECVKYANKDYDAIDIPVKFIIPDNYIGKCIHYSVNLETGDGHYPNFIKRNVWVNLDGLNENMWYVEDIDFSRRFREVGYTIKPISAVSLHDQSQTIRSMVFRARAYAESLRRIAKNDQKNSFVGNAIRYLEALFSQLKENPKYAAGIILMVLIRLNIRIFTWISRG